MKKLFLVIFFIGLSANLLCAQGWMELGTGYNALKANAPIGVVCADSGGIIYAAGSFTDSNYVDTGFLGTPYIAKWDGLRWSRLGGYNLPFSIGNYSGYSSYFISYVGVDPAHNVYASGSWTDSNGYYYVAKWDGAAWSELGTGSHALKADTPFVMCMDHVGNIYAGGVQSTDTSSVAYVARWNGISWDTLGSGSNAFFPLWAILCMCADDSGNVYIGGQFYDSGCSYVMKWDGSTWAKLGSSSAKLIVSGRQIMTLYADDEENVYAGGSFADTNRKCFVAKWDGTTWSELGTGSNALNPNQIIYTLCMDPAGFLYAAGAFTDSNNRGYVAQWDGNKWHELGTGRNAIDPYGGTGAIGNGWIYAICSDNKGNIYAGGAFTDTTYSLSPYGNCYVAKFGDADESVIPLSYDNAVQVYPNPAVGSITISTSTLLKVNSYSISDMEGRIVSSGRLENTNTTVDISILSPGMYLLQLDDGRGKAFKIIKN